MKKIYFMLFIATALIANVLKSNAATQTVMVTNFAFSPSNFTVNVGDTILFVWGSGNHTTTSISVPPGAAAWDEPMSMGSSIYMYVPTVAGAYSYECIFHGGMVASFNVNTATGTPLIPKPALLSLTCNNPASSVLNISYSLNTTGKIRLIMYDIIGNRIQTFVSGEINAGFYTKKISVADLAKGIYILEMQTPETRVTKKIMIQ